jgi:S-adenosylhomocysteine hydrolase
MELAKVTEQMMQTSARLRIATKEIFILAQLKAKAEQMYRVELAKVITHLRYDKVPATLIPDLARGDENVALLKFNRDISADRHKSGIEVMKALQSELSALQTICRYQEDI